jgi:tetratricopeptide (TPR) repeat protein
MRQFIPILTVAVIVFFLGSPVHAQEAGSVPAQTPEALTAVYQQAMQVKEWPRAIAAAQQLVALKPNAVNLRTLADAQLHSGAPDAALVNFGQALAAAEKEKPAEGPEMRGWKDNLAEIYIGQGNALLKLQRVPEAVEAYNHSAEFAANQGQAYFNICAVLYNNGSTRESATACRKCVQADPARASAWFVLGSDLFGESPIDGSGKVTASSETREALEKYLALAPDGPHADDVKAMLEMIAK